MARPKPKKWKPRNPEKYMGNPNEIISRSSWETRYMNQLDEQDNVIMWASEEMCILYISPVDGQQHRYFPDFLVRVRPRSGVDKTYLVEIKPNKERFVPTTRVAKKFLIEYQTYQVNKAKWAAAEAFCKMKGISFIVLDEYDLGIKERPKQRVKKKNKL